MKMYYAAIVAFAACAVFAVPAMADPAPQTIEVQLTSYAFTPSSLTFAKGTAYRLHLVNGSNKGHSFEGKEFFAAVDVAPDDAAKIKDGNVEVDEGQAVDISFTPKTPGSYPIVCSHFLHESLGMKGAAVIQ